MSPQGPHFSAHSTAKTNDKSTNLRKNGIYWYNDVVNASVYSEKTRMKKLMMIMIKYKSQETSFSRAPDIDFRYETKARKVMVDFKFDALYRYVSIESLLKPGE